VEVQIKHTNNFIKYLIYPLLQSINYHLLLKYYPDNNNKSDKALSKNSQTTHHKENHYNQNR
ncbi:hypothetical protein MJL14_23655, partial [Salmonella enterica subsp. enterica serovar Anatum]|nr:hypothetical protein [Salmonella enterica subsp. enterica serovar Anatum]